MPLRPVNIMRQPPTKSDLRKQLRQRRNALTPARREQAAVDLAEQLKSLPVFGQSKSIALYLADDGEIDPRRVLDWSLSRGKRCYVPVIPVNGGKSLEFAEITAHTRLRNNRFGIAEPAVPADELIGPRELDLVLVPLVGFDAHGNRIGRGGGFYDTTFEFKKTDPESLPNLVGLAHDIQRVEQIAAENWDIPISVVVTDRGVYRCG